MPYIYWDSTYILVVIGAVICMIAGAACIGKSDRSLQSCQ